jgi:hypothetical protein
MKTLKELAIAASDDGGTYWWPTDELLNTNAVFDNDDAEYIAAASPEAVLALIAERDEYRKAADDQAAAHKVERDALAKDAERYRWLKENIREDYDLSDDNPCYHLSDDPTHWDSTIDAAMAQGGEG